MPVQEQRRNAALAAAIAADGRRMYLVAASADIHPNVLSGYVHGRLEPRPEVRARIAAALGRPESELFGAMADA